MRVPLPASTLATQISCNIMPLARLDHVASTTGGTLEMIVPLVIGALWIIAALLHGVSGDLEHVALCIIMAPMSLMLTLWLRHQKVALAVRVLREQAARQGKGPVNASTVHEIAPDGVVLDTDDLPSWPIAVIVLMGLASAGAVLKAAFRVVS